MCLSSCAESIAISASASCAVTNQNIIYQSLAHGNSRHEFRIAIMASSRAHNINQVEP